MASGKSPAWDHPRMRGEHLRPYPPLATLGEDHPRMRGEHVGRSVEDKPEAGIIPACAGSTSILPSG